MNEQELALLNESDLISDETNPQTLSDQPAEVERIDTNNIPKNTYTEKTIEESLASLTLTDAGPHPETTQNRESGTASYLIIVLSINIL